MEFDDLLKRSYNGKEIDYNDRIPELFATPGFDYCEGDMIFIGIDPGEYSTTLAIINSSQNCSAYIQIYQNENEYPRKAREKRKKGQRYFDPIVPIIAKDHFNFMNAICDYFHPTRVAAEEMQWSAGASDTQANVHHFRGILHAVCMYNNINFVTISPQEIKKAVTDNGHASKEEVASSVYRQYGEIFPSLKWLSKNNHISDAYGAAIYAERDVAGVLSEDEELDLEG